MRKLFIISLFLTSTIFGYAQSSSTVEISKIEESSFQKVAVVSKNIVAEPHHQAAKKITPQKEKDTNSHKAIYKSFLLTIIFISGISSLVLVIWLLRLKNKKQILADISKEKKDGIRENEIESAVLEPTSPKVIA